MSRRAARPALPAVAALAAALHVGACESYRLVEPTPPPRAFGGSLEVVYADSARYRFVALYTPGPDPLPLRDSTVRLGDAAIAPALRFPSQIAGSTFYDHAVARPMDGLVPTAVVVRGPVDAAGASVEVSLPLLRPAGPTAVSLGPGEDLRLALDVPAASDSTRYQHWALSLAPDCRGGDAYLTLQAPSRVPAELRVPRALLPAALPGEFAACLTANEAREARGGAYPVQLGLTVRVRWTVTAR